MVTYKYQMMHEKKVMKCELNNNEALNWQLKNDEWEVYKWLPW